MSGDIDGREPTRAFGPGPNGGDRPWLVPALAAGAGLLLVILLVGIGALVLSRRGGDPTPAPTQTTSAVVLGPRGTPSPTRTTGATTGRVTPASGATTSARTTTTARQTTTGKAFVVANTDGDGVRLRATPGGDQITNIPEGTRLEQIGPDRQVDGTTWRNVRTPDGQQGWVAAQFTTEAP